MKPDNTKPLKIKLIKRFVMLVENKHQHYNIGTNLYSNITNMFNVFYDNKEVKLVKNSTHCKS